MAKLLTFAGAALTVGPVLAHDGHGHGGAHWHATDVWGFITLAGFVAIALWLGRRK